MDYKKIVPFALAPADMGYRGHILGAFQALSEVTGNVYEEDKLFIIPDGSSNYQEVKMPLFASKYQTYSEFKAKVFELLDDYFAKIEIIPKIFITVYNPTESNRPAENAEALCHAVKAYYISRKLGRVMTVVLTSKYYKYRYVDLINIPKHLMTFALRIRLIRNQKLHKKVLVTVGTINNFSRKAMQEKYQILQETMNQLKTDKNMVDIIQKLKDYQNKSKKVVFCLGGRVEGSEIIFDVNYAQKLYSDAEKLAKQGYGIVFVNGPRTPNSIADYLYEKTQNNQNIIFHNCKRIAQGEEDRQPSRWRIYSGPYEEQFKIMQKFGNIYPGILGFENTLVVHTMDSYSSCETSCAGIPTAISGKGLYIDPLIRYDCLNLAQLLCPKYAVDFDEFVNMACHMKIEPRDLQPSILSSPLRVFAETALKRLKRMEKKIQN